MAETTVIEWCRHTFNPWTGCTKVAEGCKFCYAEVNYSVKIRGVRWGPNGNRIRASDAMWKRPLAWDRSALAAGVRRRVFCASLADVFEQWDGPIEDNKGGIYWHPSPGVQTGMIAVAPHQDADARENMEAIGGRRVTMDDLRRDLFALIDRTPNLDWLLLTKRPENVGRMWPDVSGRDINNTPPYSVPGHRWKHRKNVWLGTSIATQADADRNLPELLKCRDLAPVLFLSAEPLLGSVDLRGQCDCQVEAMEGCGNHDPRCAATRVRPVDWVIVGGESGPHARPCYPEWIRSLVQQCRDWHTPVFVKQLGANVVTREGWPHKRGDVTRPRTVPDGFGNYRIHLADSKGGDPAEWPADLRIREYPIPVH